MKKSTKVTLFAAAVAGAAMAGARLARLVRLQNEELNDLINQEPGYRPAPQAPEEEPAPQAPEAEDASRLRRRCKRNPTRRKRCKTNWKKPTSWRTTTKTSRCKLPGSPAKNNPLWGLFFCLKF